MSKMYKTIRKRLRSNDFAQGPSSLSTGALCIMFILLLLCAYVIVGG